MASRHVARSERGRADSCEPRVTTERFLGTLPPRSPTRSGRPGRTAFEPASRVTEGRASPSSVHGTTPAKWLVLCGSPGVRVGESRATGVSFARPRPSSLPEVDTSGAAVGVGVALALGSTRMTRWRLHALPRRRPAHRTGSRLPRRPARWPANELAPKNAAGLHHPGRVLARGPRISLAM
jgi:hypothetical protein